MIIDMCMSSRRLSWGEALGLPISCFVCLYREYAVKAGNVLG
jgi:hypothetical protein